MITAAQSAKHAAMDKLRVARTALSESVALICWTPDEARKLSALAGEVDLLYAKVNPNGGRK